jgi:hypothetical protein
MMQSYSQSGQDVYALDKSSGKTNGFYIEIGAHDPVVNSNSIMLENLGWSGISFEISDISEKWYAHRKNKIVMCDATNYDFKNCFIENGAPQEIDYLSLDIDGASLDCLKKLPLDFYSFRSITIEHDEYHRGSEMKNSMRSILTSYGYILDRPDVSSNGFVYEDWWIR